MLGNGIPAAASSSDASESTDLHRHAPRPTLRREQVVRTSGTPRFRPSTESGTRRWSFGSGSVPWGYHSTSYAGWVSSGWRPGRCFVVSWFPLSRRRWSFPAPADRSRLELPPAHEVRTRLANQRHAYAPRPRFTREEFQVADDLGPVVPGRGRRGGRRRGWRVRFGSGRVDPRRLRLPPAFPPAFPARRRAGRLSRVAPLISAASDSTGSAASSCRRNLHGVMFLFPHHLGRRRRRETPPPRREAAIAPPREVAPRVTPRRSPPSRANPTPEEAARLSPAPAGGSNSHALRISASAATSGRRRHRSRRRVRARPPVRRRRPRRLGRVRARRALKSPGVSLRLARAATYLIHPPLVRARVERTLARPSLATHPTSVPHDAHPRRHDRLRDAPPPSCLHFRAPRALIQRVELGVVRRARNASRRSGRLRGRSSPSPTGVGSRFGRSPPPPVPGR